MGPIGYICLIGPISPITLKKAKKLGTKLGS
jgi:hypothetical protein